ncbi:D-alanine--D-alanine ligase domain protein [Desulfovibrio sp. X2]|uniref:D-alanine--D-alanine ligase family protein n=1 Tax=Desulfovibrio sp. X2 TaxID=941449 RepID=UPI000358C512|nr:hypothetical protein [Desulfovibrio sp. X2]EPR43666.1 D-alanine--D-alanine ligase domain protein [Desulfovibrio sp. X2]
MRVALLHSRVGPAAGADDQDTLAQAAAVRRALRSLGHSAVSVAVDLDLGPAAWTLARLRPDVAVNLVETIGGADGLAHFAPDLLAHLGIPFTGSDGPSLVLTNDKPLCKRLLVARGVATPAWVEADGSAGGEFAPGEFILKPCREHASKGIDADSVVLAATPGNAALAARRASERLGRPCFAEAYVAGREFAVSLLAAEAGEAEGEQGGGEVEVLPPAEMIFHGKWERPLLTYAAKWDPESPEYEASRRSFEISDDPAENDLRAKLANAARACWQAFGLAGYARVDFRVDGQGRPLVIDVNANPCLAPDAGFAAACAEAGLTYEQTVARIVAAAIMRKTFGA